MDTQYTAGGVPTILIPSSMLSGSGLCGTQLAITAANGGKAAALDSGAHATTFSTTITLFFGIGILFFSFAG